MECEFIDTEKFKVSEFMQAFLKGGGKIFACGTCHKVRQLEGSEMCPVSTMEDMYKIITESDRLIIF